MTEVVPDGPVEVRHDNITESTCNCTYEILSNTLPPGVDNNYYYWFKSLLGGGDCLNSSVVTINPAIAFCPYINGYGTDTGCNFSPNSCNTQYPVSNLAGIYPFNCPVPDEDAFRVALSFFTLPECNEFTSFTNASITYQICCNRVELPCERNCEEVTTLMSVDWDDYTINPAECGCIPEKT